jgi:putative membrane protein
MNPAMVLTLVFGFWLWGYGFSGDWLYTKVALVAILVAYHLYLYKFLRDFKLDRNRHSHVFYRWLNEIPALPLLIAIVILVVTKPF